MEIHGRRHIAAPRPAVWAALNDPAILQAAIPGCSRFVGSPETGFDATVTQRIGPLGATVEGRITLTDVTPMERYTLTGTESDVANSRAHGTAVVTLSDADGGTLLDYAITVDVGGRLARLGATVLGAFGSKLADAFFGRLLSQIAPSSPAAPAPRSGWLRRLTGGTPSE